MFSGNEGRRQPDIDDCRLGYAHESSAILESEIALFMKTRRLARLTHGARAQTLRQEAGEIACAIRGLRRALRAHAADPMPDIARRMLAMRRATDAVSSADALRLADDHRRVARGIAAMNDATLELADRDLAHALHAAEARHSALDAAESAVRRIP